jgi:hypothetical protein
MIAKADRAPSAVPDQRGPGSRMTLIGFIALGISLAATLGLYAFVVASSSVAWGVWVDELSEDAKTIYYNVTYNFLLLSGPIAIIVNIVAGFRGRGNRRAGVIGGLLLLSPLLFVLIQSGVYFLQRH